MRIHWSKPAKSANMKNCQFCGESMIIKDLRYKYKYHSYCKPTVIKIWQNGYRTGLKKGKEL